MELRSDNSKPVQPGGPGGEGAAALLARIRAGDRAAAAAFMDAYGPILRQRFRSRLTGGMRRLMDSADLVSTVSRRLDRAVRERRAWFDSEAQLWGFLQKVATGVIADKARVLARLKRVEGEDSPWVRAMLGRMDEEQPGGFDETIEMALASLESDRDRRVLALWLNGMDHAEIGDELGLDANGARQLWMRIRRRLATAVGVNNAA